jgi:hypothetical protein
VLDAVQIERLGKPTITVVQDRFFFAAQMHASGLGLPNLPFLVEPAALSAANAERSGHRQQELPTEEELAAMQDGIELLVASNGDEIVAALTKDVPEVVRT